VKSHVHALEHSERNKQSRWRVSHPADSVPPVRTGRQGGRRGGQGVFHLPSGSGQCRNCCPEEGATEPGTCCPAESWCWWPRSPARWKLQFLCVTHALFPGREGAPGRQLRRFCSLPLIDSVPATAIDFCPLNLTGTAT
jgi:hypothetical protein